MESSMVNLILLTSMGVEGVGTWTRRDFDDDALVYWSNFANTCCSHIALVSG